MVVRLRTSQSFMCRASYKLIVTAVITQLTVASAFAQAPTDAAATSAEKEVGGWPCGNTLAELDKKPIEASRTFTERVCSIPSTTADNWSMLMDAKTRGAFLEQSAVMAIENSEVFLVVPINYLLSRVVVSGAHRFYYGPRAIRNAGETAEEAARAQQVLESEYQVRARVGIGNQDAITSSGLFKPQGVTFVDVPTGTPVESNFNAAMADDANRRVSLENILDRSSPDFNAIQARALGLDGSNPTVYTAGDLEAAARRAVMVAKRGGYDTVVIHINNQIEGIASGKLTSANVPRVYADYDSILAALKQVHAETNGKIHIIDFTALKLDGAIHAQSRSQVAIEAQRQIGQTARAAKVSAKERATDNARARRMAALRTAKWSSLGASGVILIGLRMISY